MYGFNAPAARTNCPNAGFDPQHSFILWIARTLGTESRTLGTPSRTLGTESSTLGTGKNYN
jgi:hypothetical protein